MKRRELLNALKTYYDLVQDGVLPIDNVKEVVQTKLSLPKRLTVKPLIADDEGFMKFLTDCGIDVNHNKKRTQRSSIQTMVRESYPDLLPMLDGIMEIARKTREKPLTIETNGKTIQVVFQPFWREVNKGESKEA